MKVRQYRLYRYVEDGVKEEKICWLDGLKLKEGDSVTLDDYPDWMWWTVAEAFDVTAESDQITLVKPHPDSEEIIWDWRPQTDSF